MYTAEQLAEMVVHHVKAKQPNTNVAGFKQDLLQAFYDREEGDWVYGVYHHAVRNLPVREQERLQKIVKRNQ